MEIKLGDDFDPQETSRIAVADCVAFSLASDLARNKAFVIGRKESDVRPERDGKKWEDTFSAVFIVILILTELRRPTIKLVFKSFLFELQMLSS